MFSPGIPDQSFVMDDISERYHEEGPFGGDYHSSMAASSTLPIQSLTASKRAKFNHSHVDNSTDSKPTIDISLYIPLGVVHFRIFDNVCGEDWVEMTEGPLPLPTGDFEVYTSIQKLFQARWVRVFVSRNKSKPEYATIRIFVLPDDTALSAVPRTDKKARIALRALMANVDNSKEAWEGESCSIEKFPTYKNWNEEDDSLFYIFNTLDSPHPNPNELGDDYAADAVDAILTHALQGLKTDMYPYQRRSAAAMICRETAPKPSLDPRLETLQGPASVKFYFDRTAGHVLKDVRTFEGVRGGILAETMGYGKTLICLATILATKHTLPLIPPSHTLTITDKNEGEGCRSLGAMAAAVISRNNIPWKHIFAEHRNNGRFYGPSEKLLKETIGKYQTHTFVENRRGSETIVQDVHILSTTLIVVPPNLLSQWKSEITKHVHENALRIFIAEDREVDIPVASELDDFDLVLMSRTRFEEELTRHAKSGQDHNCRCNVSRRLCPEHEYTSPLKTAHFLRFIVDEGQGFSSSNTFANWALMRLRVDRKWIVSGTPTSGMIGVEVDLAAEESSEVGMLKVQYDQLNPNASFLCTTSSDMLNTPKKITVQQTLVQRRRNASFAQEKKDVERLGEIVRHFLRVRPWANTVADGDVASWKTLVVPHFSDSRKPALLRNVLQSLVVRHRIEDVEVDLKLPPLYNKVVMLQPAFVDKLSINLFILVLAANAITSERTDQDYMFHPRNRKTLEALIKNMRSSAFFWSGFTEHDVLETCKVSRKFLDEHTVLEADQVLLEHAIKIGQTALACSSWLAFSKSGEIGFYVDQLPTRTSPAWLLRPDQSNGQSLMGATPLVTAGQLVEKNIYAMDPLKPLEDGPPAATSPKPVPNKRVLPKKSSTNNPVQEPGKGIPISSVRDSQKLTSGKLPSRSTGIITPSKGKSPKRRASVSAEDSAPISILKSDSQSRPPIPQAYGTLSAAKVVGTSSAKLSYLMERIAELHTTEKIIIFYEHDNIAYYCAQALEILDIPHLIYATGISLKMRNDYQTMFTTDNIHQVMLMDLKQAALGLHMATASRVFFVNPVWQPNIEAQAIKRAHRIGQTRPVYVETLVLQDTIEDQMLQRRRSMTTQEQRDASKSLLDDTTMADMIKNMKVIPLMEQETTYERYQYAQLRKPQQVFARSVAAQYTDDEINDFLATQQENADDKLSSESAIALRTSMAPANAATSSGIEKPRPKKRKIMFADEVASTSDTAPRNDDEDLALARHILTDVHHGSPPLSSLWPKKPSSDLEGRQSDHG